MTGVTSSVSITSPSSLPAVFDLVDRRPCRPSSSRRPCRAGPPSRARRRAAASRSGRLARMSAVSAMKWTPQKAIARQSPLSAAMLAELIAVAAQVGQGDHFVLLIVVAQDQQPRAHLGAHRRRSALAALVVERLVGARVRAWRRLVAVIRCSCNVLALRIYPRPELERVAISSRANLPAIGRILGALKLTAFKYIPDITSEQPAAPRLADARDARASGIKPRLWPSIGESW